MGNDNGFLWGVVGFFIGMAVYSPSYSDKENLRMEGYNRARVEIVAYKPASQPTTRFSESELKTIADEELRKANEAVNGR